MKSSKSVFFIVSWWSKIPCHRRTRICCSFFFRLPVGSIHWCRWIFHRESFRTVEDLTNQTLHGKAWGYGKLLGFPSKYWAGLGLYKRTCLRFQLQTCCFFASHQIKRCFFALEMSSLQRPAVAIFPWPPRNCARWHFPLQSLALVYQPVARLGEVTGIRVIWDLRYGTVWYCTVLSCTVLYRTVRYCTVLLCCCVVVLLFVCLFGWLVGCCWFGVWRLAFGVVIGVWCLVFGVWCLCLLLLLLIIYSPLEFSLGNGGPGPHDSLEIWALGFSMFDHLHSLEEYRSLFDLIWWKLEVPFYRVQGYQPGSPLNFDLPFFRHQLCVSKKTKLHFLEFIGSMTLMNGTLKTFKVDQNIKKISKEWYSQSPQHKQDFHIILQFLCVSFFREN